MSQFYDMIQAKLINRKISLSGDVYIASKLGNISADGRVIDFVFAEKPEEALLEFLAAKNEEFVVRIVPAKMETVDLALKDDDPVHLQSRRNFYLNQGDNFEKVNQFIEAAFYPTEFLAIDEEKAIETIRAIDASIRGIKELDLTSW